MIEKVKNDKALDTHTHRDDYFHRNTLVRSAPLSFLHPILISLSFSLDSFIPSPQSPSSPPL